MATLKPSTRGTTSAISRSARPDEFDQCAISIAGGWRQALSSLHSVFCIGHALLKWPFLSKGPAALRVSTSIFIGAQILSAYRPSFQKYRRCAIDLKLSQLRSNKGNTRITMVTIIGSHAHGQ